jgi:hypothetical protein
LFDRFRPAVELDAGADDASVLRRVGELSDRGLSAVDPETGATLLMHIAEAGSAAVLKEVLSRKRLRDLCNARDCAGFAHIRVGEPANPKRPGEARARTRPKTSSDDALIEVSVESGAPRPKPYRLAAFLGRNRLRAARRPPQDRAYFWTTQVVHHEGLLCEGAVDSVSRQTPLQADILSTYSHPAKVKLRRRTDSGLPRTARRPTSVGRPTSVERPTSVGRPSSVGRPRPSSVGKTQTSTLG